MRDVCDKEETAPHRVWDSADARTTGARVARREPRPAPEHDAGPVVRPCAPVVGRVVGRGRFAVGGGDSPRNEENRCLNEAFYGGSCGLRISLGLVDLSRIPSGASFREVHPGSEMAS